MTVCGFLLSKYEITLHNHQRAQDHYVMTKQGAKNDVESTAEVRMYGKNLALRANQDKLSIYNGGS